MRCILCRSDRLDEPGVCAECASRRKPRIRRFRFANPKFKRPKRRGRKVT